ncbi:MAG: sulfotransferase family protein [Armatimonadota bacterium]
MGSPIFVVGCGHSGTSLLLAILGAHPLIHAIAGETYAASNRNRKQLEKAVRTFNAETILSGKKRWAEKTPKHIMVIREILDWIPGSKIVLVIRDGRDVALSISRRTGSLRKGIERWVNDNAAAEPYWNHPRVYKIKYEDIVGDFNHSIRGLTLFLEETFCPEMANFHEQERHWYSPRIFKPEEYSTDSHREFRNWQINQPLFNGSGNWKNSLNVEDLRMINDIGGEMLRRTRYPAE